MLNFRLLTDPGDISSLEPTWRLLGDKDSGANLFNSFEWIECWLEHYWQPDYRLNLVLVETNNSVVALLPIYFNPQQNALMFLGTGEAETAEVASEYLDFLIDASNVTEKDLLDFIAGYLQSLSGYNFLFVNCLRTSHVFKVCERMKRNVFELSGLQFRLLLDKPFDELAAGFSKNFQKKSREIINRFNKADGLRYQPLSNEQFEQNWTRLRDLHTRNWNEKGRPGAFQADVFNAFHMSMHERYPAISQHFAALYSGETAIAINHYYEYRDAYYFYLTGAEKDQYARISPGLLLHTLCIRQLSGMHYWYDFLKGSARASYKAKFCSSTEAFFTIKVFAGNPFNFLRYLRALLRARLKVLELR